LASCTDVGFEGIRNASYEVMEASSEISKGSLGRIGHV
jgi:hypothetical protein